MISIPSQNDSAQSRDREWSVQPVRHTHIFTPHQTLLSLQQGKTT
jgi:hypothetical protein